MNSVSTLPSRKVGGRDRDRTGDPCLQSIGLDSIRSIHYCQLLTFPTIRGTCFPLDAIFNAIKTLDFCTVRAQRRPGSEDPAIESSLKYRLRPSRVGARYNTVLIYADKLTAGNLKNARSRLD